MFRKNLNGFLNLEEKFKPSIFFIEFEDFAVNPWNYLNNLENFLGTKVVQKTKKIMKREKCPRNPEAFDRQDRIIEIEKNISSKYKLIFQKLINDYDKKPWKDLGYK
jgi:hypothetical protein